MTDEFVGSTVYVPYRAACPVCENDAEWLGWSDINHGAKDTASYLRVDCQWCALSEAVSA